MNDPYKTLPHSPIDGDKIAAEQPGWIGRYRIERVLGQGGFGIVYLAHDDQLHRPVAIKVPHPNLVSRPEDAEAYLIEARTVANLDHANIVPVYDLGSTPDCPCYVVSKFIEGSDLAKRIKADRPSVSDAAELTATVAQTLHYAHKQGIVHRDVKPGNILLDVSGKPFVADFGLALREQDVGQGPRYAGTPAYMSPEQARGEGHRVDGRSDLFSLGVVFYEMLTGRRPFKADSVEEVLEQVKAVEARPPRQGDDTIPKELERICLKALSKRASDRYTTGKDMADDLRHFFEQATQDEKVSLRSRIPPAAGPSPAPPATPVPSALPTPTSDQRPVKIVPKGLRSFDAHDADFFLELLPGPRDRDGLPDSIRFWKTRIEEADADNTFSVGLIYGPSGCGKSSLVKAGLLPRLSDHVLVVYVEATAEETETRLLNGLRKRCPALSDNPGLQETLGALRRGQGIAAGKKVLIVLDQFEQWLHARRGEENTELVQALRQCDGGRVQCVVMVRDDFWLAATRFLVELEINLVQGENTALADLFGLDHARKVLRAFGVAFGRLPETAADRSKEQQEFLNLAIQGLAQEGKIVCVRLALFAEMMKGKSWTPASLKAVGGTAGVGVTFLEETFSSQLANPKHRLHQKAARAVLKALLPESGTDIKGHMRSHGDLLEASGYSNRPKDFDDLIHILDGEIRLITPTDPEGKEGAEDSPSQAQRGQKYYQLTHDYLVPSLRDWLTRKQKETRRGRAELLLADRAATWNARPENRQLPSLPQWLSIRWLTRKKTWTPPQRKMMRQATRFHVVRAGLIVALLLLAGLAGWEGYGRLEARRLRDRVLDAATADVPAIVAEMPFYRRWVNPLLQEAYLQAKKNNDRYKLLHASLALAPVDPKQKDYLYDRLLEAEAPQVTAIRQALAPHKAELSERLWDALADRQADLDRRFRAACALANYTPDDPRWPDVSADMAARLVNQEANVLGTWAESLQPVGTLLLPPLASFLEDEKRQGAERRVIANLYKTFAKEQPDAFAPLERMLVPHGAAGEWNDARNAERKKQANAGVALIAVGQGEKVWPLLKNGPDSTLRSYLIDRVAPGGVDPRVLLARFGDEQDGSIKRALLLSLGEFGLDRLPEVERRNLVPRLEALYRDDPDAGLHGAAEWVLRRWLMEVEFKKLERSLDRGQLAFEGKDWCVTREGHTMVLVRNPPGEVSVEEGNEMRKERIDVSYAIGSKEVTVEQFTRFRQDQGAGKQLAPTNDCPMMEVSWHDAAAYCNWLSKEEGIPKDQWCYEEVKAGEYKAAVNHLQRPGYRLATEAEWEYACRAGAKTGYSYGEPEELLDRYAWFGFDRNSSGKSHPVGLLKPNDLGLFDMHGNASEWCDDWSDKGASHRVFRGGSWYSISGSCRAAIHGRFEPTHRVGSLGLRVARVPVGAKGK